MFSNLELERYKYVSYKMSNSKVRMMSMHGNEMNNVKAHYEILYNVGIDDEVVENNQYIKLDNYLINIVNNTDRLF